MHYEGGGGLANKNKRMAFLAIRNNKGDFCYWLLRYEISCCILLLTGKAWPVPLYETRRKKPNFKVSVVCQDSSDWEVTFYDCKIKKNNTLSWWKGDSMMLISWFCTNFIVAARCYYDSNCFWALSPKLDDFNSFWHLAS